MKNKEKLLILFLIISFYGYSQKASCISDYGKKLKIKKYLKLPKEVNETSGLIIFNGNFLTHNDSGGEAKLYQIDPNTGQINGIIEVTNAKNRDWEDITQDEDYIFIGDFGNNSGKRKDLKIYKIAKKDIKEAYCKVKAEIIQFSYTEQTNFERKPYKHNFDCEAITSYGDSLLIFTKNWKNKKTRIYRLSKEAGTYEISTLQSCNVEGLVTGASYNSSLNTLVLIGYNNYRPFIVINKSFHGQLDKKSKRIKIKKKHYSQTEGIFLDDEGNLFISSEKTKAFPQRIYKLTLDKINNN